MTETQHTPGPWYSDGLSVIADYQTAEGNKHHCHVADVTNRNEINRAPSMEECANAKLIAAAPDLLRFAQQIFIGLDSGMIHIKTPVAEETLATVLTKGRAATSKAKKEKEISDDQL